LTSTTELRISNDATTLANPTQENAITETVNDGTLPEQKMDVKTTPLETFAPADVPTSSNQPATSTIIASTSSSRQSINASATEEMTASKILDVVSTTTYASYSTQNVNTTTVISTKTSTIGTSEKTTTVSTTEKTTTKPKVGKDFIIF